MNEYYRFIFSTDEIIDYSADMMSFRVAERRAIRWAKDCNATYTYIGIVTW